MEKQIFSRIRTNTIHKFNETYKDRFGIIRFQLGFIYCAIYSV